MNREIKFRGQDKYGCWVYGSLVNNLWKNSDNNEPICEIVTADRNYFDCWEDMIDNENIVQVISKTVGQYTGLKDKNGKEIYEGDKDNKDRTIEYRDGTFCVVQDNGQTFDYLCHMKHIEIIGNIHDNPELLTQRSNAV